MSIVYVLYWHSIGNQYTKNSVDARTITARQNVRWYRNPVPYEYVCSPGRHQTQIDEAAALEALQAYAKKKCCWGTSASMNTHVTGSEHRSFLHVRDLLLRQFSYSHHTKLTRSRTALFTYHNTSFTLRSLVCLVLQQICYPLQIIWYICYIES